MTTNDFFKTFDHLNALKVSRKKKGLHLKHNPNQVFQYMVLIKKDANF